MFELFDPLGKLFDLAFEVTHVLFEPIDPQVIRMCIDTEQPANRQPHAPEPLLG